MSSKRSQQNFKSCWFFCCVVLYTTRYLLDTDCTFMYLTQFFSLYPKKDQQGIEEPFFFLVNEWFKTYTDKTQALKVLTWRHTCDWGSKQCTAIPQGSHPECLKPSVQSPTTLTVSQASLSHLTIHYTDNENFTRHAPCCLPAKVLNLVCSYTEKKMAPGVCFCVQWPKIFYSVEVTGSSPFSLLMIISNSSELPVGILKPQGIWILLSVAKCFIGHFSDS